MGGVGGSATAFAGARVGLGRLPGQWLNLMMLVSEAARENTRLPAHALPVPARVSVFMTDWVTRPASASLQGVWGAGGR